MKDHLRFISFMASLSRSFRPSGQRSWCPPSRSLPQTRSLVSTPRAGTVKIAGILGIFGLGKDEAQEDPITMTVKKAILAVQVIKLRALLIPAAPEMSPC